MNAFGKRMVTPSMSKFRFYMPNAFHSKKMIFAACRNCVIKTSLSNTIAIHFVQT